MSATWGDPAWGEPGWGGNVIVYLVGVPLNTDIGVPTLYINSTIDTVGVALTSGSTEVQKWTSLNLTTDALTASYGQVAYEIAKNIATTQTLATGVNDVGTTTTLQITGADAQVQYAGPEVRYGGIYYLLGQELISEVSPAEAVYNGEYEVLGQLLGADTSGVNYTYSGAVNLIGQGLLSGISPAAPMYSIDYELPSLTLNADTSGVNYTYSGAVNLIGRGLLTRAGSPGAHYGGMYYLIGRGLLTRAGSPEVRYGGMYYLLGQGLSTGISDVSKYLTYELSSPASIIGIGAVDKEIYLDIFGASAEVNTSYISRDTAHRIAAAPPMYLGFGGVDNFIALDLQLPFALNAGAGIPRRFAWGFVNSSSNPNWQIVDTK